MTNEEKAKDITKCLWFPQKCTESDIQNMLMVMAQWKDEQAAKEKRQWIDEACEWFWEQSFGGWIEEPTDELIEEFVKAMKG